MTPLPDLAQESPPAEEAEEIPASDVEVFQEMEEDGVGRMRGVARPGYDLSGYTALSFLARHDAQTYETSAGFAPELSGLVVNFRPARPVKGRVHLTWSPETGFAMSEVYGQLGFAGGQLDLRAGRWLLPIGLFNHRRYAAHERIVPELPIASSTLMSVPQSTTGLELSADRAVLSRHHVNGAIWLVNAPQATWSSFDAGLPADMVNDPFYEGADTPLAVGGRLAFQAGEDLRFGVSGQLGDSHADGSTSLALGALHAAYSGERLRVDAEWLAAQQQVMADFGPLRVSQSALTVAAGVELLPVLEPVAQLEWVRLSSDSVVGGLRFTGGANLRPFPSRWPDAKLGVAYAHHIDALGYWRDSRVGAQIAVGF